MDGIFLKKIKEISLSHAKCILIGNIAHLGDVALTLECITSIKHAYPSAKLYFLSSSTSLPLLSGIEELDGVIVFDHFKHQRNRSFWKKIYNHITTFIKAWGLINKYRVELYIETYPFYGNGLFLSACSSAPFRIGYGTGGGLSILTKSFPITIDTPLKLQNRAQLKELGIACQKGGYQYKKALSLPENFVLIHLEASSETKSVSCQQIKPLLSSILGPLVFTGTSKALKDEIDRDVMLESVINLVGRCELTDLVQIIQRAQKVMCVDTVIFHLAEHFSIPVLLLKKEKLPYSLFDPSSASTQVIFIKEGEMKDADLQIASHFFSS